MKRYSLTATALVFSSLSLFAQNADDRRDAQRAAGTLSSEIVVSASALPEEVATTPVTVTVITREEIEQRKERDLSELLREVPGITLSRSGSEGKATSLFMRGADSTQTLVMWNGVKLNNPYFGGYDWGQFSTAGVEQVEVIRGPFSALYGSDAYAGAVSVISGSRGNDFDIDLQAGENGLLNGLADLSFEAASLHGNVTYDQRNDDGFTANDDYEQTNIVGGVTWQATENFSAGVQARQSEYALGIPFSTNAAADALVPTLRRRQDGTESQISIPIRHRIGRFSYDLTLSRSELDYHFEDPDDPYGFTFADTAAQTDRGRLLVRYNAGVLGTITVGGETETAEVDAATAYGPTVEQRERKSTSYFIEDRLSHAFASGNRLEVSIGVRNDDFEQFGSELSPRVAAAYVMGSNKFRAAYGEGFRAPSLAELYYPFLGNEELEPEQSRNIEAGFDRYVSARTSFSLTLFRSDYEEMISAVPPSFTYQNIGEVRSQGAELGLKTMLGPLQTSASYTWLDAKDLSGNERLRRPKHSGSLALRYVTGALDTTLSFVHSGERSDILPVLPFTVTMNEAYTRGDVLVQYRAGSWTPYVRVENVTDEEYEEVLGYASPGRRALFGLRYSLK